MRSHLGLTNAHVRLAAFAGGWRRASDPEMDGSAGPNRRYIGPGGIVASLADASVLPAPLRFAVRASQMGIFRRVCPCCGRTAEWLTDEQLEAARQEGVAGSVLDVHRTRLVEEERESERSPFTFAIRHDPECAATERSIERMAASGAN